MTDSTHLGNTEPNWHTAQKAMRANVRYAAALEQIKIVVERRDHPIYKIADEALQGR